MSEARLDAIADLSEADRAESRALRDAVYSPEEIANWPGNHLEWAMPEWCVRVRDGSGALVGYAGVLVREGSWNGAPARIGGIGGVRTHPAARRQGHATAAMARAVALFRELGDVDFALIVCEPRLLATYARMGWQRFGGELRTLQHGASERFTFNEVMTHAVRGDAPLDGVIDLAGPPW